MDEQELKKWQQKLERWLPESQMDYSLKVNLYYKGLAFTPCHNCPFKNENPAVPIWEKTEKCFQRCPYEIVIWILSKEQLEEYEKLRPTEKRKKEIERVKRENKIAQIEKIRGTLLIEVPSFFASEAILYLP